MSRFRFAPCDLQCLARSSLPVWLVCQLVSCGGSGAAGTAATGNSATAASTVAAAAAGAGAVSSAGATASAAPAPSPGPAGTITGSAGSVPGSGGPAGNSLPLDVPTWHYSAMRNGLNVLETTLIPANVNATGFGKLAEFALDGAVDAQPLYLSQLVVGAQGARNVLYVATQHGSLYALDADSLSGGSATVLWQSRLLASGESPVAAAQLPCGDNPSNGIMATPVIDRARNAIYAVAMSVDANGNLHYRLHALDLATGAERNPGPTEIVATAPGIGGNSANGTVTFDSAANQSRAALLEAGGSIVIAWGGRDGDCGPYSAWVMSYDATTLVQTSAINLVPNDHGAGIWMSGAGPAMDATGRVLLVTGNAFAEHADGTPATGSFGNSVVELDPSAGLAVADYFSPFNSASLSAADLDLGGGGILLLPDLKDAMGAVRHVAVLAGKDSTIYMVDRDNLGKYNTSTNNILQAVTGQLAGQEYHSQPTWFNGQVYFASRGDHLKAFALNGITLAGTPATVSAHAFADAMPVVSASGTSSGIVWVDEGRSAVLYAYDASNLGHLLYSSDQAAAGRDQFSGSVHARSPLVVNGRVYLGTSSSIVAFGLLP